MEIIVSFLIILAFLGMKYPMLDNPKDSLEIFTETKGLENVSLHHRVKPFSEYKFKNIVKQEYDYSCGSAALATLFNAYLGESFTEHQVIQGLMQYGEVQKIEERRAFSLLDMKRFTEVLGYDASGYKAEYEDLVKLDKPAIIPIEFYGYKHFVVFKGAFQDHVFVADPFMGNMSYPLKTFQNVWKPNIVFIVSSQEARMNALKLQTSDLRVVDLSFADHAAIEGIPPSILQDEQRFLESFRDEKYLTINIE